MVSLGFRVSFSRNLGGLGFRILGTWEFRGLGLRVHGFGLRVFYFRG